MDWPAATGGDLLGGAPDLGRFTTADRLARLTWSLPERIADALVQEIIQGTLEPGQRLHETSIAERFGVSRGPVREALRVVEKEGLIVMRPRYGSFVAKLTATEVRDIFEVRATLLSLAARRVAENGSPAVLAFLREGSRRLLLTVGEPEPFFAVVYRCTLYVTERVDNALARAILLSLARRTLYLTRVALLQAEHRRQWARGWRSMERAVGKGLPAEAEAAMRGIVERVCAAVLAGLEAAGEHG